MTFLHSPDLPNPERLFLAEPPIYNSMIAFVYSFLGIRESLARLVSVFLSLGTIIFLFALVRDLLSKREALWACFFSAILPFSVFYSRVILPEPLMLFACLGMLFFFKNWLDKRNWLNFSLAVLFSSLALTQKAFPFFLSLPMVYLVFKIWRLRLLQEKKLIFNLFFFLFIVSIPIVLWRLWIVRFPEGVPPYDWLFNQGGIRFRPAFFRWIFGQRIGQLILGLWGLPLFVLGLSLKPSRKSGWFFHWWLVSFLVYVSVFAAGNVTHDYYQIPFIPIAAIFLARGTAWLLRAPRMYFSRFASRLLLAICVLFMVGFSWYQVRDFYTIQGGVDLAGKALDVLVPKEALILTGDSNDATLLYNCNRHGWTGGYASYFPNEPASIKKAKSLGAQYYVTTKFNDLEPSEFGKFMFENFRVLKKSDQYIIFDLR
jgi:4-amino-4-deoxy-L-arabinose transferase-like glycosyltransferase